MNDVKHSDCSRRNRWRRAERRVEPSNPCRRLLILTTFASLEHRETGAGSDRSHIAMVAATQRRVVVAVARRDFCVHCSRRLPKTIALYGKGLAGPCVSFWAASANEPPTELPASCGWMVFVGLSISVLCA